ncbi:ATP-grasp domain-containing protein [Saccharopolyspora spinosa]|uniref:ATP-grasp domain-containing protein n=1 Tax=Saccharopolyspora spinosa TaxID=60894 RepID=UPI002011E4B7|nr:ATP-grasp domain-containing protein [Saccharopolyspora spinosa]
MAAFREHSVPAAAAVAAELGLPFVSEQAAQTVRDKYAMREALDAENIPQPGYGLARTIEEAMEQAARIGFPMVLKPLIDNDSMYVRRVDDRDELVEHFAGIQRGAWGGSASDPLYAWAVEKYEDAILLEEYLPGTEISVESMLCDGKTNVVAVHDKPLPMEGPYFADVCFTTPSRFPEDVLRRVHELTAAAHRAIGIDTGATHTAFRIQEDGTPKIVETAARLGGGPVYQSILLSTGVDMVSAVLDVASGRAPDLSAQPVPTPTGFYLFFAERAGKVSALTGVRDAERSPHVHELALFCEVGSAVDVPPRAWQPHGHVVFTADSGDELRRRFYGLASSIQIELE